MTDIKAKLLKLQSNLENIDASSPNISNDNDSEAAADNLIDDAIDSRSNYNSMNMTPPSDDNSNVENSCNGNNNNAGEDVDINDNNNAGEDVSMAETVDADVGAVSNDVEMTDNEPDIKLRK